MTSLAFVILAVASFILGYRMRDIKDSIEQLKNKLNEKQTAPTVTMGAYAPKTGTSNVSDGRVGLVSAKTPQLLQWEADQKLEREVKLGIPQ